MALLKVQASGNNIHKSPREFLGIKSSVSHDELFCKHIGNTLNGICATYVYDTLHIGDEKYFQICQEAEYQYKWKSRELDKIQFLGLQIDYNDYLRIIHKNQNQNLSWLAKVDKNDSYRYFGSLRAKFVWCNNQRPVMYCGVAFQSKSLKNHLKENIPNINQINKIVKHLYINENSLFQIMVPLLFQFNCTSTYNFLRYGKSCLNNYNSYSLYARPKMSTSLLKVL